jgi:hypothetical protein
MLLLHLSRHAHTVICMGSGLQKINRERKYCLKIGCPCGQPIFLSTIYL